MKHLITHGAVWVLTFNLLIMMVKADYEVNILSPTTFSHFNNSLLFNGSCCNDDCTECTATLRYCVRDSGHPTSDTTSCLLSANRDNLLQFTVELGRISACYTGSLQIYIRVSHQISEEPDFDPPFSDSLIDDVFVEVTNLAAQPFQATGRTPYEATGQFTQVFLRLRARVTCAQGFNGSDCNTFCNDTDGELVCEQAVRDCNFTTDTSTTSTATTAPPTSTATTAPPTTTPITPTTSAPLGPSGSNNNVIGIAIGATLGGILVLVIILIIIGLVVIWLRRSQRKGSYDPQVVHNVSHYPLVSNRDSVTESQLKSRPKSFDSFSSESQSTSTNSPRSVTDTYSTVNKKGTNKSLYTPPYVPEASFNQQQDMDDYDDDDDEHTYQNTISIQEQKRYTGVIETEIIVPNETPGQDGLVYADLDISRQGTMQTSHEEAMRTHSNMISVDEDATAEPYDNIEVQYTTVKH